MDYHGIDSVVFGADDLQLARKLLSDWGLAKVNRTGKTDLHHIAFEVRDVHEVFGGGREFTKRGWTTEVGPGRHPISSAYFWYFRNPLGGAIEYFCDPDFITERWKPNNYRVNRFSEWHLVDGIVQKDDGRIRPSLAAAKAMEAAQAQAAGTSATATGSP